MIWGKGVMVESFLISGGLKSVGAGLGFGGSAMTASQMASKYPLPT